MKKHVVNIIESERGWGAKVDEVRKFDTWEEADTFVEEYNKKSMPPLKAGERTPDIYCRAEYAGIVHE
jgi:hypothetical protein